DVGTLLTRARPMAAEALGRLGTEEAGAGASAGGLGGSAGSSALNFLGGRRGQDVYGGLQRRSQDIGIGEAVGGGIAGIPRSVLNRNKPQQPQTYDYGGVPSYTKPTVRMARGGIVTKPTVALIGEKGPEAVVPLGGRKYSPPRMRPGSHEHGF